MNNNISPKNVTRAEEDLQVARLQHDNRNTLASAAKVSKAEKHLARLMKQVDLVALDAHRKMQAKMADMQAELDNTLVEGLAGGGMVKVMTTAKGAMKSITIDPSLMNPDEREILEDLIIAACSDARTKGERVMEQRMAEITKGLPIPPGMKLF
jgi:DNA-binding YbaB/EbfC family protein